MGTSIVAANLVTVGSQSEEIFLLTRQPPPFDPGIAAWTTYSETLTSRSWASSPSWLQKLTEDAGRLLQLPPNWDSYGAQPISPDFIRYAFEILTAVVRPSTPMPVLVPTVRGGVQIEWHAKEIDLEIRVESTSRIHVAFEDPHTGSDWEEELISDLGKLDESLSELSRRK